jgi:3-oxoacyl-(acyl-carrier-protein) synthase
LVAAYVDRFNITKFISRETLPKGIGRHTQFAAAAAVLALSDAGLDGRKLPERDTVIITGSSLMDFGGISSSTQAVYSKGADAALPRTIFTTTNANVTETIGRVLGIGPRTMTLQNSCCSGLDSVGLAASMVARGEAEIAICGGTEAPLHRCPLLELRAAGLTPPTVEMSDRLARPFDLWRTTGVVSEGACMFVLEPEESPRRGYSFVAGYSFANDPSSDVCGGLVEATRLALADARLKVGNIESINAWAPGHTLIDSGEASALRTVFGKALREIPVVSIKGSIGSALGAAPAIQLAAVVLGHTAGAIPPTVNWSHPDPACALNLSSRCRFVNPGATLLNAHGVGNVNSCMILLPC